MYLWNKELINLLIVTLLLSYHSNANDDFEKWGLEKKRIRVKMKSLKKYKIYLVILTILIIFFGLVLSLGIGLKVFFMIVDNRSILFSIVFAVGAFIISSFIYYLLRLYPIFAKKTNKLVNFLKNILLRWLYFD